MLGTRTERFMDAYKVLKEILNKPPYIKFRALCISFSHPANKLTDVEVTKFLNVNFGELDIYFKTKRQQELFYEVFTDLLIDICSLLVSRIVDEEIRIISKVDRKKFMAPVYKITYAY